MTEPRTRTAYVYVARRIDPNYPQNLGDFSIVRADYRSKLPIADVRYRPAQHYHYNSRTGRLINRGGDYLPVISRGSRIYVDCTRAVGRLLAEEEVR